MEIIRGLPEREYRARSEKSQSDFKHFLEPTPAHAKHAMDKEHEDTDSMLNGTCLHALILEDKKVYEVGTGTTQKNPKQPENGILLSPHNAKIVEGMAAGIRRNKGAMLLLESSVDREISLFWDGMKARLDGVCPLGPLDIKSTKGADLWAFSKSLHDYGYHIQGAHYLEGAALAGFPADDFYIIAAENFAPFECAVYKIGHRSLEVGARELARLKELYFECARTGVYPGYSEEPVEINIPAYAMEEI